VVRRAGAGNDNGVSGTDFVGEATTELYGSDPEGFTERRAALAAEARAAGDRPAAKEIARLRKPSRPAWMINMLVRADPGVADQLVRLGDELRAAAAALDGPKIRELSQERRRLVDSLIRQALRQAGEEAPSAALREDLTATFGAAVADPQAARALATGTLLRPIHRADFSPGPPGLVLVPPTAGTTAGAAGKARTAQPEKAADRPKVLAEEVKAADRGKAAGQARAARAAEAADEAKAAREAKAAAETQAAKQARAAEERRRAIADAEQVAAEASRAADQAAQDEHDEQATVWGLEDQLDEARRRLSATRRRVRETQGAQQKARRALGRLKDTER
jgi:hypothetical protein